MPVVMTTGLKCPQCKSTNTDYWRGFHSKDRMEPDEPEGWSCEDCNHHWSTLAEDEEVRADHEYDEMKDRERENRNE